MADGTTPEVALSLISGGEGAEAGESGVPEVGSPEEELSPGEERSRREGSGAGPRKSVEMARIEQGLIESLGTKVTVNGSHEKGRIEISYYSMEDLERLSALLGATLEE